ncbi:MAG: sodium:proton antiporter [Bacillales bacterium]|jgi:Na+/H+-dicarboxylate symporter|nr:sodium:proton antiporter [Bacillales bacterium]
MNKFFKGYGFTLILLGSIIIGGIVGLVFGEDAVKVQPLGDLLKNLLLMMIVPLVFFSVSSAIANMTEMKRFGKIMTSYIGVVVFLGIVTAIIGFIATLIYSPVESGSIEGIKALMGAAEKADELTTLQRIVNMFTVGDFSELLTRQHVLQLIVFSVLFGVATALSGEKGKPLATVLKSGSDVFMKFVDVIMYYAPIGLGAYFASTVGQLGSQIVEGYARSFGLYLVVSIIMYFGVYTLYAYLAGGTFGVKTFWKNVVSPSLTAISTCSSAACIPINVESVKKMGVPSDIAEMVIPLGTNTNKVGSMLGGIFKIVFLFAIYGKDMTSISAILSIIGVAFLVGVVIGAVPGGDTIGVLLILSFFGFPETTFPLVLIISTIIDIPATLLNATGNTITSLLVTRLVEGKDWIKTNVAKAA